MWIDTVELQDTTLHSEAKRLNAALKEPVEEVSRVSVGANEPKGWAEVGAGCGADTQTDILKRIR